MDISRLTTHLLLLLVAVDLSTQACTKVKIKNGRVRLRRRGKMAIYRCRSTFTIYGSSGAVCIAGEWSHKPPKCIAPGCPVVTATEGVVIEPSHNSAKMSFTCIDSFKLEGPPEIFCDKVNWDKAPPVCLPMSSMLSCDFEQTDLCGWTQSSSDDFDWLRHTGQTPSGDTGPSSDHTFGQSDTGPTGHYMFIETSNPRKPGDAAELWSPLYLPDQSDQCFELYYHMMGKDDDNAVGSLDILVKLESQPVDTVTASFHDEGNKGDEWIRAEVTVPPVDEKFQFIVIGTRLESYASDIAIDDVRLYNCSEVTTVDYVMDTSTTPMIPTTTATLPATTATITIRRPPTTAPQPTLTTPRPTRRSTATIQTTRTTVKPTTTRRASTKTTTRPKSTTQRSSTTETTPTKPTTTTVAPTRTLRPTTNRPPVTTRSVTRVTTPPRQTTTTLERTTKTTPQMTMPQKTTKKPKWTRKPRWTRRPKTPKPTTATKIVAPTLASRGNESVSVTTIAINNTVTTTEKQFGNTTTTINQVQQTTTEMSMHNSSAGTTNSSDIYYQTNESADKKNTTPRPTAFLPLAIGIGGGVVFVIIVIAILATVWAKKKKRQAVEPYEELEPITKAVSKTSLNLNLVNDYTIIDDD